MIRRWWWLILVCTLLAGSVAYFVMNSQDPLYEATATLLIKPGDDANSSEINLLVAGERLALTYSEMIKSKPVLDAVISDFELEESSGSLARKISAVPIRDTQLILLTVEDSSGEQAALIANALAQEFTEYTQEINTQRYASQLENLQEKIEAYNDTIEGLQTRVDTQTTNKIEAEANLTRLDNALNSAQEDSRLVQQTNADLKRTISQEIDNVKIAERANIPQDDRQPPYTASTSLLFEDDQMAATYVQLLTWQPVLEAVVEKLELEETPESLGGRITTSPISGEQLIQINVSDNDAAQAVLLADTFAAELISQIRAVLMEPFNASLEEIQSQLEEIAAEIDRIEDQIDTANADQIQAEIELARLETSLAENRSDRRTALQDFEQLRLTASSSSETITLTEPASVPLNPSQNNLLYIALATLVGLMIGTGAAFLLEYLDDTIKSPDKIRKSLGLDTIGVIPRLNNQDHELIAISEPRSPIAETYRMLGNNLRVYRENETVNNILVTSPNPEEGKSVLVSNLGITLAASGIKTVVIDADLRRPRMQGLFKLKSNEGLTGCLLDGSVDGRLQPTKVSGLSVITCGEYLPSFPTEMLNSQSMGKILQQLNAQFDIVLIDTPPMLAFADAAVLAPEMDGVLLVVKSGETRLSDIKQTLQKLEQLRAKLLGLVLNGAPVEKNRYHYYYQERKSRSKNNNRQRIFRKKPIILSFREWLHNRR